MFSPNSLIRQANPSYSIKLKDNKEKVKYDKKGKI